MACTPQADGPGDEAAQKITQGQAALSSLFPTGGDDRNEYCYRVFAQAVCNFWLAVEGGDAKNHVVSAPYASCSHIAVSREGNVKLTNPPEASFGMEFRWPPGEMDNEGNIKYLLQALLSVLNDMEEGKQHMKCEVDRVKIIVKDTLLKTEKKMPLYCGQVLCAPHDGGSPMHPFFILYSESATSYRGVLYRTLYSLHAIHMSGEATIAAIRGALRLFELAPVQCNLQHAVKQEDASEATNVELLVVTDGALDGDYGLVEVAPPVYFEGEKPTLQDGTLVCFGNGQKGLVRARSVYFDRDRPKRKRGAEDFSDAVPKKARVEEDKGVLQ